MFHSLRLTLVTLAFCTSGVVIAQELPSDYQDVLKVLDRKGDFKGGVLKVNIPRNDLKMTIQGVPTPTPFGFGGWVSLTKASDGMEVMMGDLVLLQDEVNPVMSALLDHGIEVTALHNHFFWDEPHVYYMHVHGMGKADLVDARIHSMASTPSGIRPGFRATRIYSWVRGARQHKVMSVRAAKSVGDSRSITRRLAGLQLRVNEYVTSHRTAA